MGQPANYAIEVDRPGEPLVIRDVGPWDRHFTITNDAENVVKRLADDGHLPPGRKLYYYDSEGDMDEILVTGARFVGFRTIPR